MLRLKFLVILSFVIMLVGCGEEDPLEQQGGASVQIEVKDLVAGIGNDPILALWNPARSTYQIYMELMVRNLGKENIIINNSSFFMEEIRDLMLHSGAYIIALCDPSSLKALLEQMVVDQVIKYYYDRRENIQFVLKPEETVVIGLFAEATIEPPGKLYLIYGNREITIPLQERIETAVASGKRLVGKLGSGLKEGIRDLPKEVVGPDDAPMVLIPAGEFRMGDNDGCFDERPAHTVYLDPFYMDKYEVTNAQYRKFVQATGHQEPEGGSSLFGGYIKPWQFAGLNDDYKPVVCVSWEDAQAYAKWAGKRLPTEAEWEKAARGGLVGKKYVWGDEWPPLSGAGNFADEALSRDSSRRESPLREHPERLQDIIHDYDDGYAFITAVGRFVPNGYNLYDIAGNVTEWCNDWYDENYYSKSPEKNPRGPDSGQYRVLRGDNCYSSNMVSMTVTSRTFCHPNDSRDSFGFRCAMDAK